MQDDCVIFEVKVNADAPHGVSWDRCDKISVSQMNQLVLHFQQKAHRLCWPQESGRHLLHELPPSGLFLIIKAKFHSGFALRCCTSQTCCARPSTRCPRSLTTARSLSLLLFKGSSMSCRFVLFLPYLHFWNIPSLLCLSTTWTCSSMTSRWAPRSWRSLSVGRLWTVSCSTTSRSFSGCRTTKSSPS